MEHQANGWNTTKLHDLGIKAAGSSVTGGSVSIRHLCQVLWSHRNPDWDVKVFFLKTFLLPWIPLQTQNPVCFLQLCSNVKTVESSIHHFTKGERDLTLFAHALAHRAGCICICTLLRKSRPEATKGLLREPCNVLWVALSVHWRWGVKGVSSPRALVHLHVS